MLLDNVLPHFDVTEVHSIRIKASPEVAFAAMTGITLGEMSRVVRWLLFLRSVPERLVGRGSIYPDQEEPLLSSMQKKGFVILAENAPHEVVFGAMVPANIGRVWKASSRLDVCFADAGGFLAFDRPDYVRVAANLLVEETGHAGFVIIRTESRCRALSPGALEGFLPYWRIIRPFSGLIRRLWLRGIKGRAEDSGAVR